MTKGLEAHVDAMVYLDRFGRAAKLWLIDQNSSSESLSMVCSIGRVVFAVTPGCLTVVLDL